MSNEDRDAARELAVKIAEGREVFYATLLPDPSGGKPDICWAPGTDRSSLIELETQRITDQRGVARHRKYELESQRNTLKRKLDDVNQELVKMGGLGY